MENITLAETTSLRNETKKMIDSMDYDQILLINNYAHKIEMRRNNVDYRELKNYMGKIDLDIDLDVLRGRNDPR